MKILLADTDTDRGRALAEALARDPSLVVRRVEPGERLFDAIAAFAPDVVLMDMKRPDRDALEGVRQLSAEAPQAVVLFVDSDDAAFMEEAIAAGVCSYNVVGVPPADVKPILRAAVALFRRHQQTRSELDAARTRLAERAVVDRAKALLIRQRRLSEPEAHRWLQRQAMARGVEVRLSVEPSWATLLDKLAWGMIDAAVMLPPLALAAALGLRGPPVRLVVPMGVSLGGNAITFGPEAADAAGQGSALDRARRFAAWVRGRPAPPRLGVVHVFSTHHLLLRYWLAAGGLDPAHEVRLEVVPPEQVVAELEAGRINGFCAGAPWGEAAVLARAGRIVAGTSEIWASHPEKCLALATPWAERNPDAVQALLRAMLGAGRFCDDPAHNAELAALLEAGPLHLPSRSTQAALPGGTASERIGFHAHAAWFPWRSHAMWFLAQMRRWGWLPAAADLPGVVRSVYRPDLLAPAATAEGLASPESDVKPEGAHASPWLMPAHPVPLAMAPDRFMDGAVFAPANVR